MSDISVVEDRDEGREEKRTPFSSGCISKAGCQLICRADIIFSLQLVNEGNDGDTHAAFSDFFLELLPLWVR
jgi:hypothetical protein